MIVVHFLDNFFEQADAELYSINYIYNNANISIFRDFSAFYGYSKPTFIFGSIRIVDRIAVYQMCLNFCLHDGLSERALHS